MIRTFWIEQRRNPVHNHREDGWSEAELRREKVKPLLALLSKFLGLRGGGGV